MTEPSVQPPLSRVELLVLGRLSAAKGATETEIAQALKEMGVPLAESELPDCVTATLASLRGRSLVAVPTKTAPKSRTTTTQKRSNKPRKTTKPPPPRFKLTEPGGVALRSALGVNATPTWKDMSGRIVPALALGEEPGSEAAGRALASAEAMIASLLRRDRTLGELTTVAQLCDRIIARALGMPPGPVTPDGIRAFALAMHCGAGNKAELECAAARFAPIKAAKGAKSAKPAPELKLLADRLAHKQLRVEIKSKATILRSLQQRWVSQLDEGDDAQRRTALRTAPLQPPRPASTEPLPPGALSRLPAPSQESAEDLLLAVQSAMPMIGSDGRYGKENVFVSALWIQVARNHRLQTLSLDGFKRWLVAANRNQLVALARADLVDDMDARLVEDSEIEYLGATFHFVLDRRESSSIPGQVHHDR